MPRTRVFESSLVLPCPRDEVFAFFADAANLEELTPPWLNFRVTTPAPLVMRPGLLIDYRLKLRGIPVRWRSEITAWEPPARFVDEQRRGPYKLWRHEHRFEEEAGGTLCLDRVEYQVPLDALAHRLIVRPELDRIFAYRRQKLVEHFGRSD